MPPTSPAPAAQDAPLWSIGYVSSTSQPLDDQALAGLLAQSRDANAQAGVTGVLLHCAGNVMQVIEGPFEAVNATWSRILADPRHRGVIELWREPVGQRDFAGWSMACSGVGRREFDGLAAAQPGVRRQLLAQFWAANR